MKIGGFCFRIRSVRIKSDKVFRTKRYIFGSAKQKGLTGDRHWVQETPARIPALWFYINERLYSFICLYVRFLSFIQTPCEGCSTFVASCNIHVRKYFIIVSNNMDNICKYCFVPFLPKLVQRKEVYTNSDSFSNDNEERGFVCYSADRSSCVRQTLRGYSFEERILRYGHLSKLLSYLFHIIQCNILELAIR